MRSQELKLLEDSIERSIVQEEEALISEETTQFIQPQISSHCKYPMIRRSSLRSAKSFTFHTIIHEM
jgi:hypothetical protein